MGYGEKFVEAKVATVESSSVGAAKVVPTTVEDYGEAKGVPTKVEDSVGEGEVGTTVDSDAAASDAAAKGEKLGTPKVAPVGAS